MQSAIPLSSSVMEPARDTWDQRIPLDLEVPVTWFPVPHDGERHRLMFAQLCTVISDRPFDVRMKPVTGGHHHIPRQPREGGIVFSYHSVGDGENIWRIKETPVPGWYSFDANGFSGWSSLAVHPEQHLARMNALDAAESRSYVLRLREQLRSKNLSKYTQSGEAFSVDRPFVYFPLQKVNDPVAQFCRINSLDVLYHAAELAESTGIPLVVKRHPLCDSDAVAQMLAELPKKFTNVIVSNASIHEHLQGCRSVIVANSGVGMEALLYFKPVFTFAGSEYELATNPLNAMSEVAKAFSDNLPDDSVRAARYIRYFLEECCFNINDIKTVVRCVDQALMALIRTKAGGMRLNRVQDNTAAVYGHVEHLRTMLANAKIENERLRRTATQAVELVTRVQAEAARQASSAPVASAEGQQAIGPAMIRAASTIHNGGLSASIGEMMANVTLCSAYSAYAEMAVFARRAPELTRIVNQEILRSGYASGTDPRVKDRNWTANDYQKLHENSQGYQENNWLLDHVDAISSINPGSVIEVGCGNGRFLRKIAPSVRNAIGLDWARSPHLTGMPWNVEFRATDVLKDEIPAGDVCVSADVLEHFAPDALPGLLGKMHAATRFNYHVIACYDDGHSHCSVLHPGQWLALFNTLSPDYRLVATITRPGRPDRMACVITNIPDVARFFPKLGPVTGTWETETQQKISFLSNFTVVIGQEQVATWFPMQGGTAGMKWNTSGMVDLLSLNADGSEMQVSNLEGLEFTVRRAQG